MDIEFFGANCIRLTSKKASVVIDDNLAHVGGKSITRDSDVTVSTQDILAVSDSKELRIMEAGEYEVQGVSVHGIQARAHTDQPGERTATMYKFIADGTHILVTGHVYPELDDQQLEAIGRVDVMIVPVGGNGFTLDPLGALKLIRKVEPSVVVPTQYAVSGLKYEVPALSLEEALPNLAMQPKETVEKLKGKTLEADTQTSLIVVQSWK
jgi:L-ascorbate metabolism protein UlaG (beta-lactamase superfamily)